MRRHRYQIFGCLARMESDIIFSIFPADGCGHRGIQLRRRESVLIISIPIASFSLFSL
jgi:hypothetical protein